MKLFLFGLSILILAACATTAAADPPVEAESPISPASTDPPAAASSQPFRADLENFGPAPELENEIWLNTSQPLRLADLRGKVVLLDMWTFG
jgi:hypothetical protein